MQERRRSLFEQQQLEALAYAAADQQTEARKIVLHVLTQTRREGYQRLFLDEGQPMETLLKAVVPQIQGLALATYCVLSCTPSHPNTVSQVPKNPCSRQDL
jgi:LuxR family maltose regulon positive regulatory protein